MALGPTSERVLLLVMRQGLAIVGVGLVIGAAVAIEGSRLATKLLFHVTPTDAVTYIAVTVVLAATAMLACLITSRVALRADPASVFRGG